jgi:hypothetical protein
MFGINTRGLLGGLAELLLALVGAAVISTAVAGFRAEWQALFKRSLGNGPTRILIYAAAAFFEFYNGMVHKVPSWEIVVLALLTAFSATGIYRFAERRQPA